MTGNPGIGIGGDGSFPKIAADAKIPMVLVPTG